MQQVRTIPGSTDRRIGTLRVTFETSQILRRLERAIQARQVTRRLLMAKRAK